MAFSGKKAPFSEGDSTKGELIRRFKSNPFVFTGTIIILVIVIIAFVLVPAIVPEAGMGPGGDLIFGYYDKVPIAYVAGNYFALTREGLNERYQSMINETNASYINQEIWRQSFNAAAIHTGILQEMKKAGYTVPAKVVDREMAKLPAFQENGHFSPARYQAYDSSQRLNLWSQLRDELTASYYRSDISGLLKPSGETAFISGMSSPQRRFDMAVFAVDSYPDSEVAAYAEENSALFQVAHLSKVTITSSEANARKILSSVTAGTLTFEESANTQSRDSYADRGGDMGIKLAYELAVEAPGAEDREKLLALKKGEYSGVIKVNEGWAFFRAEEDAVPVDTATPGSLEKIRAYLWDFERNRMEDWAIARAEEFIRLVKERGFDGAIIEQSLKKRSFGPLPVNYGDLDLFASPASSSVEELSDAAWTEDFWKTAFSTPLHTPSDPLVHGSNVLVLFPLEESDADESTFSSIESTLSAYWIDSHAEQDMEAFFLRSGKLENHFEETYRRIFPPN
jgi:hypothetical protein